MLDRNIYHSRSNFSDIDLCGLDIKNPKLSRQSISRWDSLFPYYAGYDCGFAERIIESANMDPKALILDPWNGSGTTTYAASKLGLRSIGFDLNPAMLLTARARSIARKDAIKIGMAADTIIAAAQDHHITAHQSDPLAAWFDDETTSHLRMIEKAIRQFDNHPSQENALYSRDGVNSISDIKSFMYVILFSLCCNYARSFKSSNPTWIKKPSHSDQRLKIEKSIIQEKFKEIATNASEAFREKNDNSSISGARSYNFIHDSTQPFCLPPIDMILTSPPYCTRIDYTSVTAIQLAVASPLLSKSVSQISGEMIGSIKSPKTIQPVDEKWGHTCISFLDSIKRHRSKASSGYYYKTHIDYYFKIAQSIHNIQKALKFNGVAILVVQDSYYKELHNDLPSMITEMAEVSGLKLLRRDDYPVKRSMHKINTKSRYINQSSTAIEAVLCFKNLTV